ncbi:pyridoxal 5'-phosphate synthase glutaminase subunit PdxT [Bacillus spizizenii]|jgi:pyridoxal 5'-phosphate synthase pdxT subunit|uniref:Pyridoxal 5'-phosphate synthase subunit PdxT n=1 Tax=Bacillus spizizenii (strain DSM 15029 / JCM 12233 / NBRC 101239 / NRRL B-23049 / TU-B-10) TaxID=1052585 RepID=G4NPY4_BACS4|nr:pyridoxal 5'-phosphate synthase glutaminase subunit PdxT [Bacillus spizizenii]AEP86912.1 glutamine amidotransferase subunit PdxT [Bacillus spizizenii TU-B-10]MCI4166535.1 pyridoxal 5'-phosphate synthase glutaminase subunit PdxT [Bacillus spizizenii]GEK24138.1 pyridoxal 5'-phosphate synthase subunit PdxT [Bacillus spizizenii]
MAIIGVLGLQGAVSEHVKQIKALGLEAVVIKKPEQLEQNDGLILPGGESTTMRKLIDRYDFFDPLKEFYKAGKVIFGTCAGMVLVAKELASDESYLEIIDISVKRNAFGRQIASFEVDLDITGLEDPFKAVFIRAPYIESAGQNVEVLAKYDGKIVAAREGNVLTCAFHPELTADTRFLQLFVEMVEEQKQKEGKVS